MGDRRQDDDQISSNVRKRKASNAIMLPTAHASVGSSSKTPRQLPAHVIEGVKALGNLGPITPTPQDRSACPGSVVRAAIAEARAIARSGGDAPSLRRARPANMDRGQQVLFRRRKSVWWPAMHRMRLLRCNLRIGVDESGEFAVEADELAESSDDETEFVVDPLRQHGAQPAIPACVHQRPVHPSDGEYGMIAHDLWIPNTGRARQAAQRLTEVHKRQPWRKHLRPALQQVGGLPPRKVDTTLGNHTGGYVPTDANITALHNAQALQRDAVEEIISNGQALRLGLTGMASQPELDWWKGRSPADLRDLEKGLGSKGKEGKGLDTMRKQVIPHIRMYDVSAYYYKVWRTLHTPAAKTYYINKCRTRRANEREDVRTAQASRLSAPMRAGRGRGSAGAAHPKLGATQRRGSSKPAKDTQRQTEQRREDKVAKTQGSGVAAMQGRLMMNAAVEPVFMPPNFSRTTMHGRLKAQQAQP